MKKQSSTEWLVSILNKKGFAPVLTEEEIQQAKAMHKKESELIFECGRNFQLTGEGTFNQVYNETFGGDDE